MKEQIKDPIALLCRDCEGHVSIHDLPREFTVVKEGYWTQEHKYQTAEHIIKHSDSGKHYCLKQYRSGSYHSYWHHDATDITEVKQVTKTITVTRWVAVEEGTVNDE